MSQDNHKIDADDRNVFDVLNERKFTVDYFQREFSWGKKHIEQLITDLTSAFLDAYNSDDPRTAVESYNNYYLGPFVVSSRDGNKSIIDGQQRLTSLTLFLIYLNNLQKETDGSENIEPLIFSEKFGEKSFNIQVKERERCLDKLFHEGEYNPQPDDDESTLNMAVRYEDVVEAFPEEIKGAAFPYFLDWLKYNVILVEITAYSDDNAYAIFESMNDRGLNLTSTEMLKGYVLSRFSEAGDREKANAFWKQAVQELHAFDKEEDQQFFQAWLRAQYAVTIRAAKVGSSNEDFEKIGTRFHSWVRENLEKMGLEANRPDGFKKLVETELKFYLRFYQEILNARKEEKPGLEYVHYINYWGIADSLSMPLMLAPLRTTDSDEVARRKINSVARYIETFSVRRSINYRQFGASSIRYTMYNLVKELRGVELDVLKEKLRERLGSMEEDWGNMPRFRMHGQNRRFVKFILARLTSQVERDSQGSSSFTTYMDRKFEVEHIWANKFREHQDEFEQEHEFDRYRNRIGDLVLLQRGTNQSYGAKPYSEKLEHYLKENLLVMSLHPRAYEKNPNFTKMVERTGLPFKAHENFKKADIQERTMLYLKICERIWGDESWEEEAEEA
jgi:uncharacterized protein with ParB-like and HNH nuclease domain